jgi:hypothetical protein
MLRAVLPITHDEVHVTFSAEGLQRLKHGLEESGLDPKYFAWPPQNDPERSPYRGLRPLEAEDAGIFFGRDGPSVPVCSICRRCRSPDCLIKPSMVRLQTYSNQAQFGQANQFRSI